MRKEALWIATECMNIISFSFLLWGKKKKTLSGRLVALSRKTWYSLVAIMNKILRIINMDKEKLTCIFSVRVLDI